MFITISNLFPRPDHPTLGMFNFRLFREFSRQGMADGRESGTICLVPEWRVWRWPKILRWNAPPALGEGVVLPVRYIPVLTLPLIGRSINWWFYSLALRKGLKTLCPQSTIYVPWLYPDGVAVARAIQGRGIRLWLMALGSDTFHLKNPARRRLILDACEQAEGIVCVAQTLSDRLAEAGAPMEKLHVVPNGVETSLFRYRSKEEAWKELGAGEEPSASHESKADEDIRPTPERGAHRVDVCGLKSVVSSSPAILFVGNLVPVKGPDILLRAFAHLVTRASGEVLPERGGCSHPPSHSRVQRRMGTSSPQGNKEDEDLRCTPQLLLIGDGPMRQKLERLARELEIEESVYFLGRRPAEEVARWMNVADCLCLSSLSEGMPNVVLEARASGLPVVTTPAGACPEWPLQGEHFLVTRSCSAESLAEGLTEMLGRHLSERKADSSIYAWREQAERIMELIRP